METNKKYENYLQIIDELLKLLWLRNNGVDKFNILSEILDLYIKDLRFEIYINKNLFFTHNLLSKLDHIIYEKEEYIKSDLFTLKIYNDNIKYILDKYEIFFWDILFKVIILFFFSTNNIIHGSRGLTQNELQLIINRSIFHNINNLLHGVMVDISLLIELNKLDVYKKNDFQKYLDSASYALNELSIILQRFLVFIKDNFKLYKNPVDIIKYIESQIDFFKTIFVKYSKELKIELINNLDSKDTCVLIDKIYFSQIFINLFINSYDAYLKSNLIKRDKKIDIIVSESKQYLDHIQIEFKDYATGISKDNLEQIFNLFFTTKEHGSGIGLTFCKTIVEQHDGMIFIDSDISSEIPYTNIKILIKKFDKSDNKLDCDYIIDDVYKNKKITVFVIDDNPDVLYLFTHLLTEFEVLNIFSFDNPLDAIDKAKEIDSLDIVITDNIMFPIDGFKLISILSENKPKCIFILISAFTEYYEIEEFIKKNSNINLIYLTKPVDINTFKNLIKKIISENKFL